MVGVIIVCHSYKLAQGLEHELKMFSKVCPVAIAGGDYENNYGTSYQKIKNAIKKVYSEDGVCIITDVGSSSMTSEMVLEELNKDNIKILNCPFLEGSITVVSLSEQDKTLDEIVNNFK